MSREQQLQAAQQRLTEAVAAIVTANDWRIALEFAARFHHYRVVRDTGERVRPTAHTILHSLAPQPEFAAPRPAMRHGISFTGIAGKTPPGQETETAPSIRSPELG